MRISAQKALLPVLALLGLVAATDAAAQVELRGFVESATGAAIVERDDSYSEFTLRETRLQIKGDMYGDVGETHFVVDFLDDQVVDDTEITVREGYLKFNAFGDALEVRAGRQPTTWGTGDLLFINDLFPKDWVSFFSGREDQYLKSPSDAIRLGFFRLPVNLDVVYTPQFTPDNVPMPDSNRLESWVPVRTATALTPDDELGNGELAIRANKYVGSWNWAAYAYLGFWKTPQGALPADPPTFIAHYTHPELNVWGASVRGTLFGGVAWAEGGYYDSTDDADGSDLFVPNSEIRGMVGYERQWWSDFTGGMQFYWEGMQDYDAAAAARDGFIQQGVDRGLDRAMLEDMLFLKDENRTLLTTRLTQNFKYQTVQASFFAFYSPSDEDAYVRFSVGYDYSDQLKLTVGTNVFTGNDERTLFGMNQDNDNVYARARFTF